MKILVAIDGSPQALAALEKLVGKLGFFREAPRLTLFHVHPPVPHTAAVTIVGKEAVEKYYRDESEGVLESAGALLLSLGIFTRWAAALLAVVMAVASYRHIVTDSRFEMAALYLALAVVFVFNDRLPLSVTLPKRRKKNTG